MIYARAHDQAIAEDYFAAMQRVEERLSILPEPKREIEDEAVKVREKLFQLIEQLETPALCLEERLTIVAQLRDVMRFVCEGKPPMEIWENTTFQFFHTLSKGLNARAFLHYPAD